MRRRFVLLSLAGFGLGLLLSCDEATKLAADDDGGRIDQVRLGFGLDVEGKVSRGCTAKGFASGDPILLSLQVTDAPVGAVLDVTVRDAATESLAWSERRELPVGRSVQTFEIGTALAEGHYRVEPALSDGGIAVLREFDVHASRARNASLSE
jgi:hypothetical protein